MKIITGIILGTLMLVGVYFLVTNRVGDIDVSDTTNEDLDAVDATVSGSATETITEERFIADTGINIGSGVNTSSGGDNSSLEEEFIFNLVSPSGGETYVAGGAVDIRWETSGFNSESLITLSLCLRDFIGHSELYTCVSDYPITTNDGFEQFGIPDSWEGPSFIQASIASYLQPSSLGIDDRVKKSPVFNVEAI